MSSKNINRKISVYINGKEIRNNLHTVGKEIGKLRGQIRHLTPGTDAFVKKTAELRKAQKHYKDLNSEIRGTNTALSDAFSSGRTFLNGLASGDFNMIQSGLRGIAGGVKNITKQSLKFIATPIGAAIAVLATVGLAAKKWFDFNVQVEKSRQVIRDITNESGLLVDVIRVRSEVLTKTFDTDQKKLVSTAKSMVKNLGISYNEAFDLIENGAVRGKLKNDEYLESLSEYPAQFKNAGFSAAEFVRIVETGIDLSIYKDKLPDAIKEADLAIREQNQSTKEALVNAFGKSFSEDLLKKVRTGKITTKEALSEIAAESEKVNLNQQQQAQLTADLFKGAGEDAGGALVIFDALNKSLNKQVKPLTEIQKLQKEQLDANKELNSLYTQLFASGDSGFKKLIGKGKLFVTNVLIAMLKAGVDVYNWFVDLNNESATFSAILTTIGKVASIQFKILKTFLKTIGGGFSGLGTIIEGVFTLDHKMIQRGFGKILLNTSKQLKVFKDTAIKDVKDIKKAFEGSVKMERFSIENYLTTDTTSDEGAPDVKGGATDSELTDEDKAVIKSKKKLAEFLKQWQEEQDLQKELEKFDKDQRQEEEDILRMEKELQKMAEEAGFKTLAEAGLEEVRLQKLQEIRNKYAEKRLKKKQEEDKKYAKVDAKAKADLEKAEQNLENAKMRAWRFGINNLKSIFGERSSLHKIMFAAEKLLAVNEVNITTSRAIAQARAAHAAIPAVIPPGKPNPAKPISRKAMLLNIKSAKIAQATSIGTILASSLAGRFEGGPTATNPLFPDKFGGVTGFHHANEYVIPAIQTQNPIYQPIIQRLESDRRQLQGLPEDSDTDTVNNDSLVVDVVERLIAKLDEPLFAFANIGDDQIQEQNERLQKLINTRNNAKISP